MSTRRNPAMPSGLPSKSRSRDLTLLLGRDPTEAEAANIKAIREAHR
jgi:hypothetical protein